jgi:hypothetical protein
MKERKKERRREGRTKGRMEERKKKRRREGRTKGRMGGRKGESKEGRQEEAYRHEPRNLRSINREACDWNSGEGTWEKMVAWCW